MCQRRHFHYHPRPGCPFACKLTSQQGSTRIKTNLSSRSFEFFSSPESHSDIDISLFSSLSTIVKQSEQILTPIKSSQINLTLRRTSSLHLAHRQNLSDSILKVSSSHHDELNTTQSTLVHAKETAANMSRRSLRDRKSTRLNSSHSTLSRMPSSA